MTKEKIIWVKCSYVLPVKVPIDNDYSEVFDIEENHCPATGLVGISFDKIRREWDKKGFCWGCALSGKNEIVDEPESGKVLLKEIEKPFKEEKMYNQITDELSDLVDQANRTTKDFDNFMSMIDDLLASQKQKTLNNDGNKRQNNS